MTTSKQIISSRFVTYVILSAFALVGVVVGQNLATHAQSADSTDTVGLTLSPLRTELDIVPGTSESRLLSLTNNEDAAMTVSMTVEEFSVINPQYDYAFNLETEVLEWVTFSQNAIVLEPGETKEVTYTVGVPINAEPGGRYLSMFATTTTNDATSAVASRQRIASLLYITVLGDITRSGGLVSLGAPWFVTGPTQWRATVQNTGTTHYRSRYNVVIQDLFGNTQETNIVGESLILPGTVRLITDDVPLPKFPGVYKLTYTIGLGDTPAKQESRYLIYLPTAAIIVIVFAAILIAALIGEFRTRKKLKA